MIERKGKEYRSPSFLSVLDTDCSEQTTCQRQIRQARQRQHIHLALIANINYTMRSSPTCRRRVLVALALSACLEPSVLAYAPSFRTSIAATTITTSRGHPLAVSTTARSESVSDTDMEFAAFAESLEEPVASSTPESSRTSSQTSDQTWQACVDELLDPATPLSRRQELLAKLVNANQDIQESVLTAMRERKVCCPTLRFV